MSDLGATSFVVHKIKSATPPNHIAKLLEDMGYRDEQVEEIFAEARQSLKTIHQDLVASNDFLPPLNMKIDKYFSRISNAQTVQLAQMIQPVVIDAVYIQTGPAIDATVAVAEEDYQSEKKQLSLRVFYELLRSVFYFIAIVAIGMIAIYLILSQTDFVNTLTQL